MFQFQSPLDGDLFFRINKRLIDSYSLANLSNSAKAVYPVLGFFANGSNECYPNITTISAVSGLSKNTANKGVKDLESSGLLEIKKKSLRGSVASSIYKMKIPLKGTGDIILWHKDIVNSGVWHELTPSAKNIYLAMRLSAYIDCNHLLDGEEISHAIEFNEGYKYRKYDFCMMSNSEISRIAGITYRSFSAAIRRLEHYGLAEFIRDEDGNAGYMVYFRPSMIPDMQEANKIIRNMNKKSYRRSTPRRQK